MEKGMEDSEDILHTYFRQIKGIPLLSFEEELALAERIERGDEEAKKRLIEANLRLVVKVARPYLKSGVPFNDLIQEGNMGLLRAVTKYSRHRNVRFSTYACWWIRQTIVRYLSSRDRTIRLPQRKEEVLRKVQAAYHVLRQRLMREPRNDELAAEVQSPPEEIAFIRCMSSGALSFEAESEGSSYKVMDKHEDYTYSPERAFIRKSSKDDALKALNRLKDREKRILMYRYQLNGSERWTLKKISDRMGISPETVRQIEMRALRKMRSNEEDLRNYLYAM